MALLRRGRDDPCVVFGGAGGLVGGGCVVSPFRRATRRVRDFARDPQDVILISPEKAVGQRSYPLPKGLVFRSLKSKKSNPNLQTVSASLVWNFMTLRAYHGER